MKLFKNNKGVVTFESREEEKEKNKFFCKILERVELVSLDPFNRNNKEDNNKVHFLFK